MSQIFVNPVSQILQAAFKAKEKFSLPDNHESQWKISDTSLDGNLVLVHYLPNASPLIKAHMRGAIVDIERNKVISWGYGESIEVEGNHPYKDDNKIIRYLPGTPGVVFQIFKYKGNLVVASYRRLNVLDTRAYNSAITYRQVIQNLTGVENVERQVFDPLIEEEKDNDRIINVHFVLLQLKVFMNVGSLYTEKIWYIGSTRHQAENLGSFITEKPVLTYDEAQAFMDGKLGKRTLDVLPGGVTYSGGVWYRNSNHVNLGYVVAEIRTPGTKLVQIQEIWPPELVSQREIVESKGNIYLSYVEQEFENFKKTRVLPTKDNNLAYSYSRILNPIFQSEAEDFFARLEADIADVITFAKNWRDNEKLILSQLAKNPEFIRNFMPPPVSQEYGRMNYQQNFTPRYLMRLSSSLFNKLLKLANRFDTYIKQI